MSNWKMITVGIMGLFLLFGCLGSASDNHQNASTVKTTTEPVKTAEPVKTSNAEQAQAITQDVQWLAMTSEWMTTIGNDMNVLTQAAFSHDLNSLYNCANQAQADVKKAKHIDSQYQVSAKYSVAHTEYINSLDDIENAMSLIINCGDEGWTDITKITQATELMKKGTAHINNFASAIEKA